MGSRWTRRRRWGKKQFAHDLFYFPSPGLSPHLCLEKELSLRHSIASPVFRPSNERPPIYFNPFPRFLFCRPAPRRKNPEEFELVFKKVHAQWHVVSPSVSFLCLLSLWHLGAFVWLHFHSFMDAIRQKFHLKRARRENNYSLCHGSRWGALRHAPATCFPPEPRKYWKDIISIFFKFACRKSVFRWRRDGGLRFSQPVHDMLESPSPHTSLTIFVTNPKRQAEVHSYYDSQFRINFP